jgi:hypothetical protein
MKTLTGEEPGLSDPADDAEYGGVSCPAGYDALDDMPASRLPDYNRVAAAPKRKSSRSNSCIFNSFPLEIEYRSFWEL